MKYAIITNGVVVNIAVADAPLFDNWIPADGAGIGDTWDGETFTPPAPPPPPPPEPDYDADLIAAIESATTLAALKAALIGSIEGSTARVRASPKSNA